MTKVEIWYSDRLLKVVEVETDDEDEAVKYVESGLEIYPKIRVEGE